MTVLDILGVWNLFMTRRFIPGGIGGIYRPLSETAGPALLTYWTMLLQHPPV